jgi:hypothetical protein
LRSLLITFEVLPHPCVAARLLLLHHFSSSLPTFKAALFAIMATTSTDIRATTILQGPADWTAWYTAKRRYASIKGVWQYCDPDSTTGTPLPVAQPSDNDSAETWKIWKIKSEHYESIRRVISDVSLEILRTVAITHIHLINGAEHEDPKSQLTTLRKHFKVTDQQRRLELATQYSNIQKKLRNQSV